MNSEFSCLAYYQIDTKFSRNVDSTKWMNECINTWISNKPLRYVISLLW